MTAPSSTRTVTHVAELDEFTHRLSLFGGGWAAYQEERERARLHARQRFEEYDDKRSALLDRAQREREWASQGLSKAKKADEPDKNIRKFKINQTEQLAGRAARTERAMERLEVVDEPREPWELRLTIAEAPRSGAIVARLDRAEVDRGTFHLGPVDLTIGSGERLAIVGPNGSGKTTLIDLIVGRTAPHQRRALPRARRRGGGDRAGPQPARRRPHVGRFVHAGHGDDGE